MPMIKAAMVVSLSASGFQALALKQKLAGSLKLLSRLGFQGAELHLRNPAEVDFKSVLKMLAKYDLKVPTLGTGQAFFDEGLSLTDPRASIRKKARERLVEHLEGSAQLGCFVTIGLIRGAPGKDRKDQALRMLGEELDRLCAKAKSMGSPGLVLEPLNRYETTIINTISEATELIRKIGSSHIGVLADSFHMNIEEKNPAQSLADAGKKIRHVHLADSNRWPPGQGHFDFDSLFQSLRKTGYQGWVAGEFMPAPAAEQSVRLFARFLKARRMII